MSFGMFSAKLETCRLGVEGLHLFESFSADGIPGSPGSTDGVVGASGHLKARGWGARRLRVLYMPIPVARLQQHCLGLHGQW